GGLGARQRRGGGRPRAAAVETFTQSCGAIPEAGPFTAVNWDALRPGEVRFTTRGTRRFRSGRGDPALAALDDPINGPPCRTTKVTRDRGAATFEFPRLHGHGFTLMGSPTVIAALTVKGHFAQVVARL